MATPLAWTLGSVVLVSALSLVGILTLTFQSLRRHSVMLVLVALAAGALIGDAFLHLLPEATAERGGFSTNLAGTVIVGFLIMFGLEVILRLRHAHGEAIDESHDPHGHGTPAVEPFGWLNLASDAVHNLLDGIIIAAAYLVDTGLGIATTIAVAAHEIPQELGDFAVLVRAGMKPRRAILFNLATALTALLGAILVFVLPINTATLEHYALPLIAGAFLYIGAADLIPELHHHSEGREAWLILLGLLLGLGAMWALLGLEGSSFMESLLGGQDTHAHD